MMKKKHLILVITLLVMTACGQKETTSSKLVYLNYQEAEIQEEAPKLSSLLKDIPLCGIGNQGHLSIEQTGKNPLGIDLRYDDNPVIVIGMLK